MTRYARLWGRLGRAARRLGASLALALLVCSQTFALTLAYVHFPPYEWDDGGVARGIMVDIVKQAFTDAGVPLELTFMPFPRAFEMAKAGRIDGIFNFYKTPERLDHFDYSGPVIENPLVLFVRADSELRFHSLADLSGLTVGAMLGYTYGKDFDDAGTFRIDRAASHEGNFQKLLSGRNDAYACDKRVGLYVIGKMGEAGKVKVLPTPVAVFDGHIGFTKGKFADEIERLNRSLAAMRRSGEIDRIVRAYEKSPDQPR